MALYGRVLKFSLFFFYILRENLLDKFVKKTLHMIGQVKMNKLRRKKIVSYPPAFKKNIG